MSLDTYPISYAIENGNKMPLITKIIKDPITRDFVATHICLICRKINKYTYSTDLYLRRAIVRVAGIIPNKMKWIKRPFIKFVANEIARVYTEYSSNESFLPQDTIAKKINNIFDIPSQLR